MARRMNAENAWFEVQRVKREEDRWRKVAVVCRVQGRGKAEMAADSLDRHRTEDEIAHGVSHQIVQVPRSIGQPPRKPKGRVKKGRSKTRSRGR